VISRIPLQTLKTVTYCRPRTSGAGRPEVSLRHLHLPLLWHCLAVLTRHGSHMFLVSPHVCGGDREHLKNSATTPPLPPNASPISYLPPSFLSLHTVENEAAFPPASTCFYPSLDAVADLRWACSRAGQGYKCNHHWHARIPSRLPIPYVRFNLLGVFHNLNVTKGRTSGRNGVRQRGEETPNSCLARAVASVEGRDAQGGAKSAPHAICLAIFLKDHFLLLLSTYLPSMKKLLACKLVTLPSGMY